MFALLVKGLNILLDEFNREIESMLPERDV